MLAALLGLVWKRARPVGRARAAAAVAVWRASSSEAAGGSRVSLQAALPDCAARRRPDCALRRAIAKG